MFRPQWLLLALVGATFALPNLQTSDASVNRLAKRTITPDNTCGGKNGYTCDPDKAQGGACCSSHGFCGRTENYCGAGCNPAYGICFGTSPPATPVGGNYQVQGVGLFTTFKNYTFDSSEIFQTELIKSKGTVNTKPLSHIFLPRNVYVQDGFMDLLVPGGQTKQPIACGEVGTRENHILYASVRTYAIFSDVPGTVHGNFFYKSDRQEIDIEYLTDPKSQSNPGNGKSNLQFTNQANDGKPKDATYATSPAPADAATTVHEYRIDWISGKSIFYLDGVLQREFTTNVPTKAGPWVWNNWSSGDKGFTVGPPKQDNIFKIQKIVMYYNTTTSGK